MKLLLNLFLIFTLSFSIQTISFGDNSTAKVETLTLKEQEFIQTEEKLNKIEDELKRKKFYGLNDQIEQTMNALRGKYLNINSSSLSKPLVIGLSSLPGYGKTSFVQKFVKLLQGNGFPVNFYQYTITDDTVSIPYEDFDNSGTIGEKKDKVLSVFLYDEFQKLIHDKELRKPVTIEVANNSDGNKNNSKVAVSKPPVAPELPPASESDPFNINTTTINQVATKNPQSESEKAIQTKRDEEAKRLKRIEEREESRQFFWEVLGNGTKIKKTKKEIEFYLTAIKAFQEKYQELLKELDKIKKEEEQVELSEMTEASKKLKLKFISDKKAGAELALNNFGNLSVPKAGDISLTAYFILLKSDFPELLSEYDKSSYSIFESDFINDSNVIKNKIDVRMNDLKGSVIKYYNDTIVFITTNPRPTIIESINKKSNPDAQKEESKKEFTQKSINDDFDAIFGVDYPNIAALRSRFATNTWHILHPYNESERREFIEHLLKQSSDSINETLFYLSDSDPTKKYKRINFKLDKNVVEYFFKNAANSDQGPREIINSINPNLSGLQSKIIPKIIKLSNTLDETLSQKIGDINISVEEGEKGQTRFKITLKNDQEKELETFYHSINLDRDHKNGHVDPAHKKLIALRQAGLSTIGTYFFRSVPKSLELKEYTTRDIANIWTISEIPSIPDKLNTVYALMGANAAQDIFGNELIIKQKRAIETENQVREILQEIKDSISDLRARKNQLSRVDYPLFKLLPKVFEKARDHHELLNALDKLPSGEEANYDDLLKLIRETSENIISKERYLVESLANSLLNPDHQVPRNELSGDDIRTIFQVRYEVLHPDPTKSDEKEVDRFQDILANSTGFVKQPFSTMDDYEAVNLSPAVNTFNKDFTVLKGQTEKLLSGMSDKKGREGIANQTVWPQYKSLIQKMITSKEELLTFHEKNPRFTFSLFENILMAGTDLFSEEIFNLIKDNGLISLFGNSTKREFFNSLLKRRFENEIFKAKEGINIEETFLTIVDEIKSEYSKYKDTFDVKDISTFLSSKLISDYTNKGSRPFLSLPFLKKHLASFSKESQLALVDQYLKERIKLMPNKFEWRDKDLGYIRQLINIPSELRNNKVLAAKREEQNVAFIDQMAELVLLIRNNEKSFKPPFPVKKDNQSFIEALKPMNFTELKDLLLKHDIMNVISKKEIGIIFKNKRILKALENVEDIDKQKVLIELFLAYSDTFSEYKRKLNFLKKNLTSKSNISNCSEIINVFNYASIPDNISDLIEHETSKSKQRTNRIIKLKRNFTTIEKKLKDQKEFEELKEAVENEI